MHAPLLEVTFSCPSCSRMFLRDRPFAGPMPGHLDPLLGLPCPYSSREVPSFLDLPGHPEDQDLAAWPFGLHVIAAPPPVPGLASRRPRHPPGPEGH